MVDPSNSGYVTFDTNNSEYNDLSITNTGATTGSITVASDTSSITFGPKHIEGSMLTVHEIISDYDIITMDEEKIKLKLCKQLAEEMYNSDCIYFTKQLDVTSNTYIIRARCYVVPNGDIQLLLKAGINE